MNSKVIINNILRFVLLIAFQVLVLNNVYLGVGVVPVVYILFILMLPTNTNKLLLLFLAFLSGLCVDIFSNTLGFHTFAATLIGFMRIMFADRMITQNDKDVESPSIRSVSMKQFSFYALILTAIYCFSYLMLEAFDFSEILSVVLLTIINTIITYLLILILQVLFIKKRDS